MTDAKSIISETSSFDHHGGNICDDIEELELQQSLEKFEREILQLTFENNLFETILARKTSEPIAHRSSSSSAAPPANSSQTITSHDSNLELTNTSATSRSDRLSRKRSKSRSTLGDFRVQLTLEQKLDMILSEYELTKIEKIRCATMNEKKIDQLESDLEWIDGEIIDSQLASTDFRKLIDASIDKRTYKLLGEKIDRYFIERLRARGSLINKLRDRSVGFKRQIVRCENEIRQNEELGETLNEVDFTQLKIENKQYLDKIDEKNLELVQLKRQVANFTHMLNHYKNELNIKTQDFINIQKRIDKQQALYEYVQRELITTNNEQARVVRKNSTLVEQTENYRVPEILDYVRKKALLCKLQRDCEVWKRKVEIVSMGFQQSKLKWQALQRTAEYSNYTTNMNNEL